MWLYILLFLPTTILLLSSLFSETHEWFILWNRMNISTSTILLSCVLICCHLMRQNQNLTINTWNNVLSHYLVSARVPGLTDVLHNANSELARLLVTAASLIFVKSEDEEVQWHNLYSFYNRKKWNINFNYLKVWGGPSNQPSRT